MEQDDVGDESQPVEEDIEENQALEEDEPIQPQNEDITWSKDPDYQPPPEVQRKPKKVHFFTDLHYGCQNCSKMTFEYSL